jgi:hypothetical protein
MKKIASIITVWVVIYIFPAICFALEENKKEADAIPQTWAVVISGINRDLEEKQVKADAVADFNCYLVEELGLTFSHVRTLVAKDSLIESDGTMESSLENLKKTMTEMSKSVKKQDRFIFYYTGQANVVKKKLRFNLPGKDICHDEFSKLVNKIPAEKLLIVLDCPGAGMAIKSLTDPNRLIIGAAGSDQPFSTRFSEYFIPALRSRDSDFNNDGKVTILEAFKLASKQQDDYYNTDDRVKIENPLLEDDGDGIPSQTPWTYKQNGKDGKYADTWIASRVKAIDKDSDFESTISTNKSSRQ